MRRPRLGRHWQRWLLNTSIHMSISPAISPALGRISLASEHNVAAGEIEFQPVELAAGRRDRFDSRPTNAVTY